MLGMMHIYQTAQSAAGWNISHGKRSMHMSVKLNISRRGMSRARTV